MHRRSRRSLLPGVAASVLLAALVSACAVDDPERPITPPTVTRSDDGQAAPSDGGTPGVTSTPDPDPLPTEPATTPTTPATPVTPPAHGRVRVVRTLASGLGVPWGLSRFPDGALLVSTRDERMLYRVDVDNGARLRLGRVDEAVTNVAEGGEGGLLGVAVSPDFRSDHRVYVYYSTAGDNRIGYTTLRPGSRPGRWLGRTHVILRGIPHGIHHNGGGLVFGPDGYLYAGTGESGVPDLAEDESSLGGKVLRMTTSGKPAPGNPDRASVVYSHGHRNVQGLVFDARGRLFASEFGDHDKDELNLIRPGRDYGWPRSQGVTDLPGVTSPVAEFGTEEDSPSGVTIAGGSVWMAALAGQRLWRIPLDGAHTAAAPESFLTGRYGRLRSVIAIDDRTIVVGTSNRDGRGSPVPTDDRLLVVRIR